MGVKIIPRWAGFFSGVLVVQKTPRFLFLFFPPLSPRGDEIEVFIGQTIALFFSLSSAGPRRTRQPAVPLFFSSFSFPPFSRFVWSGVRAKPGAGGGPPFFPKKHTRCCFCKSLARDACLSPLGYGHAVLLPNGSSLPFSSFPNEAEISVLGEHYDVPFSLSSLRSRLGLRRFGMPGIRQAFLPSLFFPPPR